MCVISDPKQRLAMFRKLEEMSRVRPVAVQPKQRPARLDYFKGKKSTSCMWLMYAVMFFKYIYIVYLLCNLMMSCRQVQRISKKNMMKMVTRRSKSTVNSLSMNYEKLSDTWLCIVQKCLQIFSEETEVEMTEMLKWNNRNEK